MQIDHFAPERTSAIGTFFAPALRCGAHPAQPAAPTLSASRAEAREDRLRACLAEYNAGDLVASMALPAQLSSNLRDYIGQRRAYGIDRHWVLAEYTIYMVALLALDRERRLQGGPVGWTRTTTLDRIKPVLLPVSTDLCGQRISASQSLCLLASRSSVVLGHQAVDIRCADDLVAQAADREALTRLLLVLPSTVTLPPKLCKLFARAATALCQRPIRGANLVSGSAVPMHRQITFHHSRTIHRDEQRAVRYFDFNSPAIYHSGMSDYKRKSDTAQPAQSFVITDGVELSISHERFPISSTRLNQTLTGRKPAHPVLDSAPIEVAPEPKSPFSTKKIMQILLGKLPTPGGCD